MPKTINELTEASSAANGDFFAFWSVIGNYTRKISKENLLGANLTGEPKGTWENNGFTGILPASGTIALLGRAQTFLAAQTFQAALTAQAGATITGATSITGQTLVTSPDFPPLRAERTTTDTNATVTGMDMRVTTTGNMADGFGPLISFSIQDDADVSNQIAALGAIRDGADNTGSMTFYTRVAGSIEERMRIESDGTIGINRPALATRGLLDIDQASTTGAMPPLVLDQADLDEPFITFVTTVGTGNAVEAVGAKTLTTTHFVMVELAGGIVRYFPIGTIA